MRNAERRDQAAETAGKESSKWQVKAVRYAKEESVLVTKLARAEQTEAKAAERHSERDRGNADRRTSALHEYLESRVSNVETGVESLLDRHAPKVEKLRVLMLGSSGEGDLRVGREQKRIRNAIESALHRDQIEFDVRTAATAEDLLDGVTRFRPHIVHFSGHGNEGSVWLEKEQDSGHEGAQLSAAAFASAIKATDDPPSSCC